MAEYTNLVKYIKSFKDTIYNPETESGFWRQDILDGMNVWYLQIDRIEHTAFEPVCKIYKLLVSNTFEEVDVHRIIVSIDDTIRIYVLADNTGNQGRIEGKVLIF